MLLPAGLEAFSFKQVFARSLTSVFGCRLLIALEQASREDKAKGKGPYLIAIPHRKACEQASSVGPDRAKSKECVYGVY